MYVFTFSFRSFKELIRHQLFLFATTFLPGPILFVPFLPVTYITKLKIELSMTKLIIKIAKEDSNGSRPPPSIDSPESSDNSAPSTGHNHSDSGGSETVRDMDSLRSVGLGFGKGKSYARSQHAPRQSTDNDREKACPRLSEEEIYEGV